MVLKTGDPWQEKKGGTGEKAMKRGSKVKSRDNSSHKGRNQILGGKARAHKKEKWESQKIS